MHHEVTFKGNPVRLAGNPVRVGQPAPDFQVVDNALAPVRLADTRGVRIFTSVPSLDTPVCDTETRRFNREAAALPGVTLYTISMDLPFAQKRWCGAAGIDRVVTLSDHRDAAFGQGWGVLWPDARLLARAVFVVDGANVVRHVEYVPEMTAEPDYAAALAAARALA
jgi:thiol peroxidase